MNNNDKRLGAEPIPRLIFSLALPAVAAQLINVLYNIVDRIYIGHMEGAGDLALTGVGITLPILMVISAFSAFVGMGGAPLASIRLGEGDHKGAERILGNSMTLLMIISVTLTVLFLAFKRPLLYLFGASGNLIGYADSYLTIYLIGTIFVQISLGLNTYISAQGNAKTAMLSVLIGAIANIILDPILIFWAGLGVSGAALATIFSQALSAVWVMRFLLSEKSVIRLRRQNMKLDRKIVGSIAALGVSPFLMQSTESLVNVVFNSGLQKYGGDLYVGSMTIMQSVMQLIVVPINGFGQGVQPIISYNYGARLDGRVRQTFRVLITITVSVAAAMCLLVVFFPAAFASIFTQKQELIDLTARMLPVFMAGIFAFGAQMGCQATFLALGQSKISLFLALLRKVILLVPLALILPRFFGVEGIYFSEPIADILSAATAVLLFALNFNKILGKPPKAGK
ncbi:MAG TPA: MATE family efflux transporter [Candidatus Fimivivens faecavium]|nr:MATE family efflux transporter [Candidatus Fimivivens faecavium]